MDGVVDDQGGTTVFTQVHSDRVLGFDGGSGFNGGAASLVGLFGV